MAGFDFKDVMRRVREVSKPTASSLYRARCTAARCGATWLFWERRGLPEGLVVEHVNNQHCSCGEPFQIVSAEGGERHTRPEV